MSISPQSGARELKRLIYMVEILFCTEMAKYIQFRGQCCNAAKNTH